MAVNSITYDKAFSITLAWPAGVRGTVLYALPRGAKRPSDEEILAARDDRMALKQYCGFGYRAGTVSNIQFSAVGENLTAKWIDIYYCDYDANDYVIAHECAGSFFNGICRVGFAIRYTPISSDLKAVHITVKNYSRFDIEPEGIGYSVGKSNFAIPIGVAQGRLIELPQFEVPTDINVAMHRFDDKYPVKYVPLEG